MDVIVGTAGHIDHGKTALVKALTGVDADRLPDEKRRGITIDLGFAEMNAGNVHFGFVDVPGHERFVRNMLAGASGIDIVLLVIAADEGVMPQTREHFDICRLLGIRSGVIALTKCDSVDSETLELARLDAVDLVRDSFLEHAPIIPVSARTGDRVDQLRSSLLSVASELRPRSSTLVTRLPIDRSFTVKGFGTIVTGTLASGTISVETPLELKPDGRAVRVRGVQTHGKAVAKAHAGQRVAVNLSNIGHQDISRGMSLVAAETLRPTQIIDTEIEMLPSAPTPLKNRQRVRVHLGTAELLARVQILDTQTAEVHRGHKAFVQIRLESPAVAVPGERFIIRRYSPEMTIGGGVVIDNLAVKHKARTIPIFQHHLYGRMNALGNVGDDLFYILERAGLKGISLSEIQAKTAVEPHVLLAALDEKSRSGDPVNAKGMYIDAHHFSILEEMVIKALEKFHERQPLADGAQRETLIAEALSKTHEHVAAAVLDSLRSRDRIIVGNDRVRLPSHSSRLSQEEAEFKDSIITAYRNAGLEVPRLDDAVDSAGGKLPRTHAQKIVRMLVERGELIKVNDEFYFSPEVLSRAVEALKNSGFEMIDVQGFKGLLGVSRKYAIPLLEYFDREHITARVADKRVILR